MNANQKNQAVQKKLVRARDAMSTAVISIGRANRRVTIARLLLDNRISAVPVVDSDDTPVGMVSWCNWQPAVNHSMTICTPFAGEGSGATRCHFSPLVTVTEDTDVSQIARLFSIHHIKRVPIVRDVRIVCLVARADLLHGVAATQSQSTGRQGAALRLS
jgi:CBS domain-containing protein